MIPPFFNMQTSVGQQHHQASWRQVNTAELGDISVWIIEIH
jgi:hypothetical protein